MKRLDKDVVLADDDIEAWKNATKDIKRVKFKEEKPSPPLVLENITPKVDYALTAKMQNLQKLNIGDLDNIDKKTADKFRKGQFKIQKRLDLHGLTEKEAFIQVNDFIRNAYINKLRCVLIITGKGINNENDPWYEKKGILKLSVPNWLNNTDLRPLILSFSYAKPEDGGDGALYVLIKKNRNTI